MKIHITNDLPPNAGTTVGYWAWDQPNNKGVLHIYSKPLKKKRWLAAVIGHELIEAAWCKMRGITTEQCDEFDLWMEGEYERGAYPYSFEGGFHPNAPYRWGHILGCGWEYLVIYGTFASWRRYSENCNRVMGIQPEI